MQPSGNRDSFQDRTDQDVLNQLTIGTLYLQGGGGDPQKTHEVTCSQMYDMISKHEESQGHHMYPPTGFKQFTNEDCKEAIYELGHIDRIPLNFRYKQGIEYIRTRLMHRYGDMNLNKALGVFNDVLENGSASGLGDDDDIWRTWRHSYHHQHDDFSDPGTPRFPGMILPHPTPQRRRTTSNVMQSPTTGAETSRGTSIQNAYEPKCWLPYWPSTDEEKQTLVLPDVYLPAVESLATAVRKADKRKTSPREIVAPKILTWNDGQERINFDKHNFPKNSDFEARVAKVHHSRDCTQELLRRRPSSSMKVLVTPGPLLDFPAIRDEKPEPTRETVHHNELSCSGVWIFSKLRKSKKSTHQKDTTGK